MPNSYAATNTKKFLDANGLAHFAQKLNQYPTNDVIEAVVDGIQDALDEKINISEKDASNGVAPLDANRKVPLTNLPTMNGANSSQAGSAGIVPAPTSLDSKKYLKGDGTWGEPGGSSIYQFTLDNMTNASGVYSHSTAIPLARASMKAVNIECSNPDAFLDAIAVTISNGSILVECNNVLGSSTISVTAAEQDNGEELTTTQYDLLIDKIGDITNLSTTNKSSLTVAVNELNNNKIDKPTSVAAGKFLQTDSNGNAVWGNAVLPTDVENAVTNWLDDNIPTGQTVAVDQSLTVSGAAADAKKTGDQLSDLKSAFTNRDETAAILKRIRTYEDGQDTTSNNKRIRIYGNRVITTGSGDQSTYRNGNLTGSVFSFRSGGTSSFTVLDTDFVSASIFESQKNNPWRWVIHITKLINTTPDGGLILITKKDSEIVIKDIIWNTKTGGEEYYADIISMIGDADEFALYLQIQQSSNASGDYVINFYRDCYIASPEAFGAVGDGETDDSAAIQKCLNSSLGVSFQNNKTYICNSLQVRDFHSINLNGSTLKTLTNNPIFITDATDEAVRSVHIFNGHLRGNSADKTKTNQKLIKLSAFYSTFENLSFADCYEGITMVGRQNGGTGSTVENVFRNLKFVDCYNIALDITNEGSITDSRIEGIFVNSPVGAAYGIYIGKAAGAIISNLHMYGSPVRHVALRSASHTVVGNSYFEGSYIEAGLSAALTGCITISNVVVLAGAAGSKMINMTKLSGTTSDYFKFCSLNGVTLEATSDKGSNAVDSVYIGEDVYASGSNIVISDKFDTIKDPDQSTGLTVVRLGS